MCKDLIARRPVEKANKSEFPSTCQVVLITGITAGEKKCDVGRTFGQSACLNGLRELGLVQSKVTVEPG